MSEFKYACPVCGQHMMCDAAQAGSVMECPTCFQKIVAPQTPAADGKFILTGTKYVEKKPAAAPELAAAPGGKRRPQMVWAGLALAAVVAIAAFFAIEHYRHSTGWQSADVGAVGAAGSFRGTDGVFHVQGSGADIWGRADAFHFVQRPLDGDGELSALVADLKETDGWAKGGVMLRAGPEADAAFALVAMRPDGQVQFVWRKTAGGAAASSKLAGGKGQPKWVRIVRQGDEFTAWFKTDPHDSWQPVGKPQNLTLPPRLLAGLVVCAHHAGTLSEARFEKVVLLPAQH